MPFGVLSPEQFKAEVEGLTPVNTVEGRIVNIERGRTLGKRNTPSELRSLIGVAALEGAPARQLADTFKVSESSVSAYKNGATSTSTYDRPAEGLAPSIDAKKLEISDRARTKLLAAIDEITPEKLAEASAKVNAAIARDLSSVVKNMESDVPREQHNTQIIMYAPPIREESSYDVVEVHE